MSKWLIYGLIDPRDRFVHYVGKSSDGLARPRGPHPHGDVGKWLAELQRCGLEREIEVLEYIANPRASGGDRCFWWPGINVTALCAAERWWIAYGRALGWPLKNKSAGGVGCAMRRPDVSARLRVDNPSWRPQVRAKISASKLGVRRTEMARASMRKGQLASSRSKANALALQVTRWGTETLQPCGTAAAYQRARKNNQRGRPSCGPCDGCVAAHRVAHRRYCRRSYVPHGCPRTIAKYGPVAPKPCGTRVRYLQGCRCEPCRAAENDYGRERRRKRKAGAA